ncbi:MAG: hypothetical protein QXG39_08395 [Candidatus Aenigmatarchaeota archaeon]
MKFIEERKDILVSNNKKVQAFYEDYGEVIEELLRKKYTLREIIKIMNRYFRENNIKKRLTLPFLLEVVKLVKKNSQNSLNKKDKKTAKETKNEKEVMATKEIKRPIDKEANREINSLIKEKDPFSRF